MSSAKMAHMKPEEISHHPMDQLQGFEYCIDSNPAWGEAIALKIAIGLPVPVAMFDCFIVNIN